MNAAVGGAPTFGQIAHMILNVLLAGSAGGLASLLWCQFRYGKPDVFLMYSGILGALAAISGAGDVAGSRGAVLIGVVAGMIVPYLVVLVDLQFRLDDPSGGIAIHAGGGLLGTLAAGLCTPAATFALRLKFLGIQTLGIVAIAALAIAISLATFIMLKATMRLRAKRRLSLKASTSPSTTSALIPISSRP